MSEIFIARSALYFRELVTKILHYFPSVRPSVSNENNHYLSKDSWGVHIGKRTFYRVRFRALEILGFSSFKKRCPKVALAVNSGHGRDPDLSKF